MMETQALEKTYKAAEARMESRIFFTRVPSGKRVPASVFSDLIVLSSAAAPWDGFTVERHLMSPHETGWIRIQQHLLLINIGAPVAIEWREDGRFHCQRLLLNEICVAPTDALINHCWKGPADILFLSLDPAFMAGAIPNVDGGEPVEIHTQRGIHDGLIQAIGWALKAELEAGVPGGRCYGESLAATLALHLLRTYSAENQTFPADPGGLPKPKLRRVIEYIDDHLGQELTLAELAAEVGMSPYYFAPLFKQSTGRTPHHYVMERRIEWAKRLLETTDRGIIDICLLVGFRDQSHFAKVFRRYTGMTPKAFRTMSASSVRYTEALH